MRHRPGPSRLVENAANSLVVKGSGFMDMAALCPSRRNSASLVVGFFTAATLYGLFTRNLALYCAMQYGFAQVILLIPWAFPPLTRAAIARPVFSSRLFRICEKGTSGNPGATACRTMREARGLHRPFLPPPDAFRHVLKTRARYNGFRGHDRDKSLRPGPRFSSGRRHARPETPIQLVRLGVSAGWRLAAPASAPPLERSQINHPCGLQWIASGFENPVLLNFL